MKPAISKRIRINPIRQGLVIREAVRELVSEDEIKAIGKKLHLITEAQYYDPVIKAHLPRDLDTRSGLLISSDEVRIYPSNDGNSEATLRITYSVPTKKVKEGQDPYTGLYALGEICQSVVDKGTYLNSHRYAYRYYLPSNRLLPANMDVFMGAALRRAGKNHKNDLVPAEFIRQYDAEVGRFNAITDKVCKLHSAITGMLSAYKTFAEVVEVWPQGEKWIREVLIMDGQMERTAAKSQALTTTQSRDAINTLMGWKP